MPSTTPDLRIATVRGFSGSARLAGAAPAGAPRRKAEMTALWQPCSRPFLRPATLRRNWPAAFAQPDWRRNWPAAFAQPDWRRNWPAASAAAQRVHPLRAAAPASQTNPTSGRAPRAASRQALERPADGAATAKYRRRRGASSGLGSDGAKDWSGRSSIGAPVIGAPASQAPARSQRDRPSALAETVRGRQR